MKQILLLSDTHSFMDPKLEKYILEADEVWHAGDIGSLEIVDYISKRNYLRAVYGNIDDTKIRATCPEYLFFETEGTKCLMIHISGPLESYNKRAGELVKEFNPELFICGHSHILKVVRNKLYNHLYLNPGAAGKQGFHLIQTALRFKLIEGGKLAELEAIELGKRSALS